MSAAEALGGLAQDGLDHAVKIVVHLAVPEAKHAPFLLDQEGRAPVVISLGVEMQGAELHRELR